MLRALRRIDSEREMGHIVLMSMSKRIQIPVGEQDCSQFQAAAFDLSWRMSLTRQMVKVGKRSR